MPPNINTVVQNQNNGKVNLVPLRYDKVKKNVVLATPIQTHYEDFFPFR